MAAPKSRSSNLLVYGLLLAGSAIFSLPFLWMIGTSVKVDRELFTEKLHLLPMAPRPVRRSPYIDLRQFRDLDGPRREECLGIIRNQLSASAPASAFVLPGSVDAAADSIYENLLRTSPAAFWDSPGLENKLRAAAAATKPDEAIRPALREFSVGSVQLLGRQGQESAPPADAKLQENWNVSAPGVNVELAQSAGNSFPGTAVHYDFQQKDRFVIWKQIKPPFDPEELLGVRISILPDDSWHRLGICIKSGDHWLVARREFYLASTSTAATDVTWQLPSKADDSSQVKSWLLLDATDEPPADLNQLAGRDGLSVFLVIDRSTRLQAWWGKIMRNYLLVFTSLPFWRYFATSVLVTALNIVFSILSCSLVAFAFSRLTWPGRDTLFAVLLATMMIPAQVTMIPQFIIYKALGWYNTLTPLWIGAVFANAFYVFLMRQFMKAIPRELEDAARMDGCGFWGLYWQIIIPLVKPALATISIFTFLASWNDFMTPLIYLNDERLYPLSLGLFSFRVQLGNGGDQALLMAGCFMMMLPVILLFFFAQRYFIQGVTLTGMK